MTGGSGGIVWDHFCRVCARIQTFRIFTDPHLLWLTDGQMGGGESTVVYCRWLHSTAASRSAALLSFCKRPLTLTPPHFFVAQLIFPHYLHPSPPPLSLSCLMDVRLYCVKKLVKNQPVFQNAICGNNKPERLENS